MRGRAEILVSAAVGRLVEGWCACQPHAGPPGIETLLVTGLTPRPSPLRWHGRRQLSRFVGRERALATLTDLLAQATEGRGQVVGIVGEPGIGKSRLLYEFYQHLQAQSVPSVEGQCLSYGQAIPFGPVLALLRQHCGITEADAPEAVTAKVQLTLHTAGIDPEEAAPYVFQLLGLPVGSDRLADLSPEMRKTRTFETLRQLYLASSQQHPLVLAVENLHWIDPTSEAFLASLIESLAGARLFVLFTYRPGYRPPWIDKSYATQMVLPPLSAADSRRMLGSVLPTDTITATLEQQILTKAQGNPFFLEEIAQTLVDQGALRREGGMALPPAMQLPATVQEVLGARIDQLPPEEKRLLQAAAVIGKDVPFAVLQAITELSEEALHRGLAPLQAAEFLYETGFFPVREYTFKHALTHDVAYGSLHQEWRCMLHARTVEALEALYADRLGEQVERLAHHALRGEVWAKAVTYCQQAGARAFDRAAFREAVAYFEQALQALDAPARGRRHPGAGHRAPPRFGTPAGRTGRAWAAPRPVGRGRGPGPGARRSGPAGTGAGPDGQCTQDDGRPRRRHCGGPAGPRARGRARRQRLAGASIPYLGQAYYAIGDFGRAAELLRRNVEAADRASGRPSTDLRIQSRAWLARTLSELGAFAEGRRHGEEALRLATLEGRGTTPIMAHACLGTLYLAQGDLEHAIRVLEQGLALCRASGYRDWLRAIAAGLGCAYALQGRLAEGRALLEEAISEGIRMGALQIIPSGSHGSARSVVWRDAARRPGSTRARRSTWPGSTRSVGTRRSRCTSLAPSMPTPTPPMPGRPKPTTNRPWPWPRNSACARSRPTATSASARCMRRSADASRPAPLSAAIDLYRAMDMTFWLPQAEAALTKAG